MNAIPFYRKLSQTAARTISTGTLYYWPPVAFGGIKPHPLLAIGVGNVGHVSLEIKHPEVEMPIYFSVWPIVTSNTSEGPIISNMESEVIKITTFAQDIKNEDGRKPQTKMTDLSELEYVKLAGFINPIIANCHAEADDRPVYSIFKANCATWVYDALRQANLIVESKRKFTPITPQWVYQNSFTKDARARAALESSIRNNIESKGPLV